jgi:NAD+ diphosphatase
MDAAPRLTQGGYDRAAHHRTDVEWLAAAFDQAKVLLVSPASTSPAALVDDTLTLSFTNSATVPVDAPRRFLGIRDGVPYFSVTVEAGPDWRNLREVADGADDLEAALLTSAVALQQWHGRHPHCPLCGELTVEGEAGWIRVCPSDGSHHFPRTDPAVIMLIHDGAGRCLLGRGASWPVGRYSTLAGFVEPGETLEAAVIREVAEEVNVEVTDVRYIASQPWPFPSSLMLGFTALAPAGAIVQADGVEMAEAGWFTRAQVQEAADRTDGWFPVSDEMPGEQPDGVLRYVSPPLSISRFLVDGWLNSTDPV